MSFVLGKTYQSGMTRLIVSLKNEELTSKDAKNANKEVLGKKPIKKQAK
ncbi:MAG: hypothetical protein BWY78_01451 [Alphaproteobacteria bacterium ADurb.Bin438]|nr:MAG: hypothetical protein BWY78_01451 [Alphaproteobacteria bacterium ADurb.Bin438]